MTQTLQHARVLWEFLGARRTHNQCELIVVCGSYDLRVCDYACQLLSKGVAEHLLFTGHTGNWTKHLWDRSEADIFAQRAMALGVRPDQFTLESRATNFAENIAFAKALFPDVRRATFLTKPNSIRRVALTLPVQWPEVEAWVDAPSFSFPDEISNLIGVLGVIDEMVGDVHRIMVYPSLGFQAPQVIPEAVEAAWRYLIEQGFDHHLIKGRH